MFLPTAEKLKQVREDFYRRGVNMAEWARDHGFSPPEVYSVISGRSKAKRGTGHRVAVALGLKKEKDDGFEETVSQELKAEEHSM